MLKLRRTRLAGALLVTLLSIACQGAGGGSKPAASTPLESADATFFGGDYDGAERGYQGLVAGRVPGAAAHYALLLDYTNRFQEALAAARSETQPDSVSLGRLVRAQDWAEEVPGAVATGAIAVQAVSVNAATRAFYAEALADSGQFALAREQLVAAQKGARDPFSIAEVERDWANYFRSKGNRFEELNHLQLSLRAQPRFPERQLELARHYFTAGRGDDAAALMQKIEKAHAGDYLVLTSLADTTFLQADFTGAARLYQAALKVRPNAPTAALGLAELEVATQRDFNSAHDRLLASLKANPKAENVYLYLKHLDALVLKIDPDAELGPFTSTALLSARASAFVAVGAYRTVAMVPALSEDAGLAAAAEAHAFYFLFNFGQPSATGVGVHAEVSNLPGYTGDTAVQRGRRFGYTGDRAAEDISHAYSAGAAVQHWVDAVYHRFPIIDGEAVSAGYGEAQVGAIATQVLVVALDQPGLGDPVVYPAPGQAAVPPLWVGGEVPEPLPKEAVYPSGYPITLALGSGQQFQVTGAGLHDRDGREVPFHALPPSTGDLNSSQFAIVPVSPLAAGIYSVEVGLVIAGRRAQASWQFKVGGP